MSFKEEEEKWEGDLGAVGGDLSSQWGNIGEGLKELGRRD